MDQIDEVMEELQTVKGETVIVIKLKEGFKETKVILSNKVIMEYVCNRTMADCQDDISLREWHNSLRNAHKVSSELLQRMGRKAIKVSRQRARTRVLANCQIYGVNHDPMLAEGERPASVTRAFLNRTASLDSSNMRDA